MSDRSYINQDPERLATLLSAPQALFDFACETFPRMPGQCVDPDGKCTNRNPTGHACIVGAMIPDDLFDRGVVAADNGGDHVVRQMFVECNIDLSPRAKWQIRDVAAGLQDIHDDPNCWAGARFVGEDWLRSLAEEYDLTYPSAK